MSNTDARARRNVIVLVAAQAILGAQLPISFTLGGLSGQLLSPEKCLATLPISLIVLTTMFTAPVLSEFMQRHGRQAGFFVGAAAGASGALLSVLGLLTGSFVLFLTGSLGTGIYVASQSFYRFAATDTASEAYRPKAISYVLAGGLLAAVIGPQLVNLTDGATDPVPFAGGYLAMAVLNILGAGVFLFLDIPKPPAPSAEAPTGRSRRELLRDPTVRVAMICAMVTYALMNLMMTSTPLAVVGCGFATSDAANVVMAHVLAMFAPSFFTGHLIVRFGALRVIAAGLICLAGAGAVGLAGVALGNFYIALILLGLGWNFGFIGATS
ncbi:MAG: MFS transporter, partial [Pseudomonadota bacterium]